MHIASGPTTTETVSQPQQTEALGGWSGNATSSATTAAVNMFINYSIMATEMGQSAKIVLCPSDDRTANTNFYYPTAHTFSPTGHRGGNFWQLLATPIFLIGSDPAPMTPSARVVGRRIATWVARHRSLLPAPARPELRLSPAVGTTTGGLRRSMTPMAFLGFGNAG